MTSLSYSRRTIEWSLVGAAAVAGLAAVVAGRNYGITAPTGVGAGLVPTVAGSLLLLGAVAWTVELLAARRSRAPRPDALEAVALVVSADPDLTDPDVTDSVAEDEVEPLPGWSDWGRVLAVLAAIAATAALLPVLGFTASMVGLLLVLLIGVSRRRPLAAVLVAVLATLGARLVFENWLGTALPTSSIPLLSGWGL